MPISVNARFVVVGLLASALVVPAAAVAEPSVETAASSVSTVSASAAAAASSAAVTGVVAKKPKKKPLCRKLYAGRVLGPRPTYSRGLKHYPAREMTCRAYFLAGADQDFVPQAVAVEGSTAWVSGYTYPTDVNHNRCRMQKIDLLTGATLVDSNPDPVNAPRDIGGYRADGKYEVCRHGGGLAMDAHGLWVSESGRVWLVDPNKVGTDPAHAAIRYWDTPTVPVKASVLTSVNGNIGIAYYTSSKQSSVLSWFGEDRMLMPGYKTLTPTPVNPVTDLSPYRQQTVPTQTQGLGWYKGHGGLVSTRGVGACSRVVLPGGRQFGAIPGLEDIEFSADGKRVYLMSENAAHPFTSPGEPLVPFLTQVPTADFVKLRGAGKCG